MNRTECIGSVVIFSPGRLVEYQTNTYTVDYVNVSHNTLYVYLVGMEHAVDSYLLKCNPTALYTTPWVPGTGQVVSKQEVVAK